MPPGKSGWDETNTSYRYRVRDPAEFQDGSFRTIELGDSKVKAVVAKPKGKNTMTLQALIFPKDNFTEKEAKQWVKDHPNAVKIRKSYTQSGAITSPVESILGNGEPETIIPLEAMKNLEHDVELIKETPVLKVDKAKQRVYGVVYIPSQVDKDGKPNLRDGHGQWATEDDLDAGMEYLVKEEKNYPKAIDLDHDKKYGKGTIVELFKVRDGDPDFEDVGAWVAGVEIDDPDDWESVMKGERNAFSITSKALIKPDDPKDLALLILGKKKPEEVPGQLTNMKISGISIVKAGANMREFAFMKSAGGETVGETVKPGTSEPQNELEKGIMAAVKKALGALGFNTDKANKQNPFTAAVKARQAKNLLWQGLWALEDGLREIFNDKEEKKAERVAELLDYFKDFVAETIAEIGVQKCAEMMNEATTEVAKAGRKISAARIKELKNAMGILQAIIEEADAQNKDKGGDAEVKKEEIQGIVTDAIKEALGPINERLEKVEKGNQEPNGGKNKPSEGVEGTEVLKADDVKEIVKGVITEAIKPINERLEVVEKARGISNGIPGEGQSEVQKSIWSGVI